MSEAKNIFSLVPLKEIVSFIKNLKCSAKLVEILELIIYGVCIFVCINALLYYLVHWYRNGKSKFRLLRPTKLPEKISRVLIVIAHPDDECMFFGPTLIALRKRKNCTIFVLCLSQGKIAKNQLRSINN